MSYTPEVKAAVMSQLLAGAGVVELSNRHGIDHSTISRWRRIALQQAGQTDDIGLLLTAYVRETLTTLRTQMLAFRDPSWLKQQDASAVAVLHGVLVDKSLRLLEAMSSIPGIHENGNGAGP